MWSCVESKDMRRCCLAYKKIKARVISKGVSLISSPFCAPICSFLQAFLHAVAIGTVAMTNVAMVIESLSLVGLESLVSQ